RPQSTCRAAALPRARFRHEARRRCVVPRTRRKGGASAAHASAMERVYHRGTSCASNGCMTYEQLERFRRRLLGLRIMLLRRRCQALADERGLMAERELDWTDVAANQTAATVLESLGEA